MALWCKLIVKGISMVVNGTLVANLFTFVYPVRITLTVRFQGSYTFAP